jgi:SOS-response transcriptional repressor LexA
MEIQSSEIVKRVDLAIKDKGTSRPSVCKALKISNSTFTYWEKGSMPSVDKLFKVAIYLDVSIFWLLTGKDEAGLTPEQRDLLRNYDKLDKRDRQTVLDLINTMLKNQEKEEKPMYADTQSVLLETKEVEPEYEAFEDTPVLDTNVLPIDYDMIYLPYFGKTAAGIPLDIFAEPGEYMPFPRNALKGDPEEYFVLRIQGYSMVEADIDEGDMVVIRRAEEPVHGKIMLVRYEGASTLKRLAYRGGKWRLFRNDGSDREIQVDSGGFQVQGLHVWTLKPGK